MDILQGVVDSYHRCRLHGDFFEDFYVRFLALSPEIAELFRHTDFNRQKQMLKLSLFQLLNFYADIPAAIEEVDSLAVRHRELKISEHHYELWLNALCETVAQHDPKFTPELDRAWRIAMKPGINAMLPEGAEGV